MERRAALKDIVVKEHESFRSDKNTFFRVLNILMQFPDAVARSNMLASRLQLQERQTYEHQSVFVDATEKFNDWNFKTGGLIVEHDQFDGIEPDKINASGPITELKVCLSHYNYRLIIDIAITNYLCIYIYRCLRCSKMLENYILGLRLNGRRLESIKTMTSTVIVMMCLLCICTFGLNA